MPPTRMEFTTNDETAFYRRRDELVAQFESWLPPPMAEAIDASDLGLLLDWKWNFGDRHLGRWRKADLTKFLLDWCPRKLMAAPDLLESIPLAVSEAMSFLSDRGLTTRDSDPVEALVSHAASLVEPFHQAMADPNKFGPSKSMFSAMGVADPSALDPGEIQRVVDAFNDQPNDERMSVTDPTVAGASGNSLPGPAPLIGPVAVPDRADVRASAEASPAFVAFVALSQYFAAPGRVLTDAGNLKLVDARTLVALLGTGDEKAPKVGGTTYLRRSATEFFELDHWQWWAREVGVVRTQRGRLVAVAAYRKRLSTDPVATLADAVSTLVEFGLVSAYRRIGWPFEGALDSRAPSLLGRLLQRGEPAAYDDLLADTTAIITSMGVSETFPQQAGRAFDDLVTVLERAGVVRQQGAVRTERDSGKERSGGTVTLTPFGIHVAIEQARRAGFEVDVLPVAADLSAAELADMSIDLNADPASWWTTAAAWLDAQAEQAVAVEGLLRALGAVDLLRLAMVLRSVPEPRWPEFASVARRLADSPDPAPPELGPLALRWLVERDLVDGSEFERARLLEALIVTIEILTEDNQATPVILLSELPDVDTQLELIESVVRDDRPRALALLEAVGRRHPNKAVSKLARKEAFRMRSKRATQPRKPS